MDGAGREKDIGAAGGAGHESRCIGRDGELASIAAAGATPGAVGVVIVGGPGVGKTRLAQTAVERAGRDGAEVVWIRATSAAATIPLAAVVDLLPAEESGDRLRMFQRATESLLDRAGDRPLVIGVDDAHLLDPGSAALVLHLAEKGAFVIATRRPHEPAPDAVTAIWKDLGAIRLELGPLTRHGCAAVLEAQLGGAVEGVAHAWAYATSAGNPLYLRELVADALRSGALERVRGVWRLRGQPRPGEALVDLINRRLNGFGHRARRELALLDLGQPLEGELAGRLLDPALVDALELDGLVAAEVVGGARTLRLAHPLYGEVARLGVGSATADDLRRALATAVVDRGLGPGDALRVSTWLRDAGAPIDHDLLLAAALEAHGAGDPDLALELARRAEGDGSWPAATFAQARALATLGRHEEAAVAFARIEGAVERTETGAYLFHRINTLVWGLRRVAEAEALVERAAGWWTGEAWDRELAGLRLLMLSAVGKVTAAARIADGLEEGPRDEAIDGLLATSGALAWLHAGRTETAWHHARAALPLPPADERLTDREMAGLFSWALTHIHAGRDWDVAGERVDRIAQSAMQRGDRALAGMATGLLGNLAVMRGTPVSALRSLREATAHLDVQDPGGLVVAVAGQLVIAHAMLGDAASAREGDAYAHRVLYGRSPIWHEDVVLARAAGWLHAVQGEPTAGAELLLDRAGDLIDLPVMRTHVLLDALSLAASPAAVAEQMADVVARCDAPLSIAVEQHASALAARDPDRLLEAASALEDIGALLAASQAASAAASILSSGGHAMPARRAEADGARLLDACEGATTPALRAARPVRAQLTAREREIAELAAEGRSNREIADHLTVSVRTVESHLYHAMGKLGATDRERLADLLSTDEP